MSQETLSTYAAIGTFIVIARYRHRGRRATAPPAGTKPAHWAAYGPGTPQKQEHKQFVFVLSSTS